MAKLDEKISVDCVIFGFDFEKLYVLLAERRLTKGAETVFADRTLIGNHVYTDESLDEAAKRILHDVTGMEGIYLEQFGAFGELGRTSRPNDVLWIESSGRDATQRIVTVGYVALLKQAVAKITWMGRDVKWVPVDEVKELGFDHLEIMQSALKYVRNKIKIDPAIGFELLPEKFTMTQLQAMYEVVFDQKLDKRNLRRKAKQIGYIVERGEKLSSLPKKPAQLYSFDRQTYDEIMTNNRIGIYL